MLRPVTCILAALLTVTSAHALNFELGINGGYGFGVGGQDYLADWFEAGSYTYQDTGMGGYLTEFDQDYATLGGGGKVGLTAALMMAETWGIIADIGMSFGGGVKAEWIENNQDGTEESETLDMSATYMTLGIGLKLKADSKVAPYAYVAPALLIPFAVTGEVVEESTGDPTFTDEIEASVGAGFGFVSGLGVAIGFTDMIGLNIECSPSYLFARVNEVIYRSDQGDGTYYTYTERYEGDVTSLPDDESGPDSETDYYYGRPSVSFASVSAKLALTFTF
ncbi:MAG: hypothetical protein GF331_07700 [Chitinivibrionales bacterium]|nr:hypothetical protein [Chitinivibrionales bacterium]